MKSIFVLLILLISNSFSQVDSDVINHYKDGKTHALQAVGFLAGGMVLIPVEEYMCQKYKIDPKIETTLKITSSLIMGSLSLYYAGNAAHDAWWVQLKTQRDF